MDPDVSLDIFLKQFRVALPANYFVVPLRVYALNVTRSVSFKLL